MKKTNDNFALKVNTAKEKRLRLIDSYKSQEIIENKTTNESITSDYSDCMTIAQLAAKLSLSSRTVERAISKKELLCYKIGKSVRIPISAVETWLSERSNKPR